jgi:hypothetical protein
MNEDEKLKHRVIGIRSVLKALKKDGLLDDDIMYADDALTELKDQMLHLARIWYRIGAKRGVLEALEAFLNGDLEARKNKRGSAEIVAHTDELSWERGLNVTVGADKTRIKKRRYSLSVKADLGFE